jgi:hypothetical protein
VPGSVRVKYHVGFPDLEANITIILNFYSVPGNNLAHTISFAVFKPAGQPLDGTELIVLNSVPPGMYRVEAVFNTRNSCGGYRDYLISEMVLMILPEGSLPCIVWSGDVDNNGLVNYTDRKSLNTYIHEANMSPVWLNGPARYRIDAGSNPTTFYTWEAQAAVPWQTPEGCYMDADGNGVVNNLDYIAVKINWMRAHGAIAPKFYHGIAAVRFDLQQNYPNPFNPSTTIRYSVPEASHVQLRIVDLLGREVAIPVDGVIEAGEYTYRFDGSGLSSGIYIAVVTMKGNESGLDFSKSITMAMNK